MPTIIQNLSLVSGEDFQLIRDGFIRIDDGRIESLGEGRPASTNCDVVLDGSGLLAIPGLINAHVHIGDSVVKDVGIGLSLRELVHPIHGLKTRVLRETRDDDMCQAMAATSQDMLASGITTFADFREGGLTGVKLVIKALGKSPQRGIILGRPNYHFKEEEVANESAVLSVETVNELRQTIDLSSGLGVSGPNEYTNGALKQISNLCRENDKLLAIHAAESTETTKFSLEQFSSSEVHRALHYLKPDFMIHLTKSNEEDIAELSKCKIPAVCCPRANAILGLGFPPIAELLEARIPVALGTDNVMLNAPDMFREMDYTSRSLRAAHQDEAVIGSREIFKMATLNGAKALGLDSTLGSIEEGKNADIVLLNTNTPNLCFSRDLIGSIVHRANRNDVQCVMVGGEIVHGKIPKA